MKREPIFRLNPMLLSKSIRLSVLPLLLFPLLLSCGQGGGDLLAGGGIGGSGNTSVGPITALGSIFVNGIEFQTTGAEVTIDGIAGDEKELQVGMVVKVEGTVHADGKTGKADKVIFDNNAAGPISSIDLGQGTLEIMGQTVIVDTQTVIVGLPGNTLGLSDLTANDRVGISGLADADGNLIATRITLMNAARNSKVSGRVGSLTGTTFQINALHVDYGRAVLVQFGSAGIQNGDLVDVIGTLTAPNAFLAERIDKRAIDFNENSSVKCEGFVGALYYAGQTISGFALITPFGLQRVELTPSTLFSGGNLVKVGARVKVEGVTQNQAIQAKRIDFLERVRMTGSNAPGMSSSLGGF